MSMEEQTLRDRISQLESDLAIEVKVSAKLNGKLKIAVDTLRKIAASPDGDSSSIASFAESTIDLIV